MNLLALAVRVFASDEASAQIEQISASVIAKGQVMADAIKSAIKGAFDAVKGFLQDAVRAYSQYEQLVGGVETLYGSAAGTVVENAKKAFREAGMSANEYLETVTGFANTLIRSVTEGNNKATQVTTEQINQMSEAMKQAHQAEAQALSDAQADNMTAIQRANQDALDARRDELNEELDAVRKAQSDEVEAFQEATRQKIEAIWDEYDERVEAIMAEARLKTGDIDEQIEAIDKEREQRKRAEQERQRDNEKARLQEQIDNAGYYEDQVKAQKDYQELIKKIQREDYDQSLVDKRDALTKEREEIVKNADEEAKTLKEEYQKRADDYAESRENELKQLQESQQEQLKEIQKHHADILKEMQRANEDNLREIQRANRDEMNALKDRQAEELEALQKQAEKKSEYQEASEEDLKKAAELADMITKDMSDNANKMGNSMEMVQNAYRGFSMSNFTMLDNLKLGYQGNRGEMERLLEDAEKISAAHGEMRDFSVDSFADIAEAIHIVQQDYEISGYSVDELNQKIKDKSFTEQEMMRIAQDLAGKNIDDQELVAQKYEEVKQKVEEGSLTANEALSLTGTTSQEASKTIEGSVRQMQAAWENWLVALADPDYDAEQATNDLVDSVVIAAENVIPRIGEILSTLFELVSERGPEIFEHLKEAIWNAIPPEWQEKILELQDTFSGLLESLKPVGEFLKENLPKAMDAASEGFKWLDENGDSVKALFDAIGVVFTAVGDTFYKIGNNIGVILADFVAGIEGLEETGDSGFYNVGKFFRDMGDTIDSVSKAIGDTIDNVVGFFDNLGKSIDQTIKDVIQWFKDLPQNILNALGDMGNLLFDAGKSIIQGLWDGLVDLWNDVQDWVTGIGDWIALNKGPKEYDLKLLVPNGMWIMQGLRDGLIKGLPAVKDALSEVTNAMSMGIDVSAVQVARLEPVALPAAAARAGNVANIYMTYNAGEDAKALIGDMVTELRRYGFTTGVI